MATAPPPILGHAGPLLARYGAVFSDVWGVVHDGHKAFAPACEALQRFRALGRPVILVSNAPVPEVRVRDMLDVRAVPRDAYDRIVTSGDIALAHMRARGYARVHYIGPRQRDATFFAAASAEDASLPQAEAVVCTGLDDDETETAETYRPLLEEARSRGLPFVCANPDFVVDVGGRHYLCAGALADLYAQLGGEVIWCGKPHPLAYETALVLAGELAATPLTPDGAIVIGDSLRTDITGARDFGSDALFVASGIHHHEVIVDGRIDPSHLARLFSGEAPAAAAAMTHLAW